ncbi:MAG: ABC transporter permease [Desulfuromonadaceae bacterium]
MDHVKTEFFENRADIRWNWQSIRYGSGVAGGLPNTAIVTFMSRLASLPKVLVATVMAVIFVMLWELAVRTGLTYLTPVPTATRILQVLGEMALAGTLWDHTSISLLRVTVGYLAAVALAIPVGFLLGWFKICHTYLDPPLQLLRQVPLLAWFPMFLIVFGVGEFPKILLLTMTAFWWILLGTVGAVRNIDAEIVRTARSLGISHYGMFRKIALPAILPSLFASLRLAYTEVILILIAVEGLGAKAGLGSLLVNGDCHPGPEQVMIYSICVFMTAIGLAANYILIALQKRLCGWQEEIDRS